MIRYFDDRFYAFDFPLEIDESWIKHIPPKLIYREKDCITVYPMGSTTILGNMERKRFIEEFKGKYGLYEATQRSEKALKKGRDIHDIIDQSLKLGATVLYNDKKAPQYSEKDIEEYHKLIKKPLIVVEDQEIAIQVARYQQIVKDLKPIILSSEEKIFNIEQFYAGTIDQKWLFSQDKDYQTSKRIKIKIKAGKWINDLKTGKWFDETSYWRQMAAYFFGLPDWKDYEGAIITWLNYDETAGVYGGRVYLKTKEELMPYFEEFLWLKTMCYRRRDLECPRHYDIPSIITFNKIQPNRKPKKVIKKKKIIKKSSIKKNGNKRIHKI